MAKRGKPRVPRSWHEAAAPIRDAARDPRNQFDGIDAWRRDAEETVHRLFVALRARKPDAAADVRATQERYWRAAVASSKAHAQADHRADMAELDAFNRKTTEKALEFRMRHAEARRSAGSHDRLSRLNFAAAAAMGALLEAMGHYSNPLSDESGPTVEVLLQPARRDPITRLALSGKLDPDQVRSAREIEWVLQAMTAEVGSSAMRIVSAGTAPKGSGRRGGDVSSHAAWLHAKVYRPWLERCDGSALRGKAVLDIVVHGVAVAVVARRERMRPARVEKLLGEALELYQRIRDNPDRAYLGPDG